MTTWLDGSSTTRVASNLEGRWQRVWNPRSPAFGAAGTGLVDDATPLQNTIDACSAAGGGVVWIPNGEYKCRPDFLHVPSGVFLVGESRLGTIISKNANGVLLDWSGTSAYPGSADGSLHTVAQGCVNLTLNGGNFTGYLTRHYHTNRFHGENVLMRDNADTEMACLEMWDSRFYGYYFGTGGSTSAAKPCLLIENSNAASGFGWSNQNSNELHFYSATFEAFKSGCISVQQGATGVSNANGIYFINLKMESNFIAFNTPLVNTDSSVKRFRITGFYMWAGNYNGGYSTPPVAFWLQCSDAIIQDGWIGSATASFGNAIYVNAGNQVVLRNILGVYGTMPGWHLVIDGAGGTSSVKIDNVESNATNKTIIVGQPGTLNLEQAARQTVAYAGTITPDPALGKLVAVGTLTANIIVANPTNFWAGAELTFRFTQDATGGRTITFGTAFKKIGWTPVTTANAVNTITFVYDGTSWMQRSVALGVV